VIRLCILAFPSLWYNLELLDKPEWLRFELRRVDFRDENFLNTFEERSEDLWREEEFEEFYLRNILFSTLSSFLANPTLSISNDNTHHTMIVTILILDHASLSHASSSIPTLEIALNKACFQYTSSHIHDKITNQFAAPPGEYSISQFNEFILQHRL